MRAKAKPIGDSGIRCACGDAALVEIDAGHARLHLCLSCAVMCAAEIDAIVEQQFEPRPERRINPLQVGGYQPFWIPNPADSVLS